MKAIKTIIFLVFLSAGFASLAQIPPRPSPPRLVNDNLNLLTSSQQETLENKLVEYDKQSSTQIAIYTTDDIVGMDAGDFATELGRKWGVGNKTTNNGVVVLVYRSKDNTKRKVFIAPGYGLEGVLPDYTCSEIVNNEMIPRLKGQDYFGALNNGADAIIKATQGRYTAPKNYYKQKGPSLSTIIFIIIVIILLISIFTRGGGPGGRYISRRGYRNFTGPTIWWTGGGGSSGGGGWSGGGGGGFGGFGGGGFGGGGAGGDW